MLVHLVATLLLGTSCSGSYLPEQLFSDAECYDVGYSAYYDTHVPVPCGPTIAVLPEEPYSMAKTVAPVPLLAVPQNSLKLVQDLPTHPVISLKAPTSPEQLHGMIPAIRVFLHRPMMVSSPESVISFPSGVTVVHDGLPVVLSVSALVAPLPSGAYFTPEHPIAIRVVYALSVSPLHVQEPFYQPLPSRKPILVPSPIAVTTPTSVTTIPAVSDVSPPLPSRPQQTIPEYPPSEDSNLVVEGGRPGGDVLVTVLDFPTSVASPPISFYPQISLDEETGLDNREPPQAAVPAGIVQSTAPLPNLSVFVNSKESSVLQALRDEAEKKKAQQQGIEPISSTPSVIEILKN